MLRCKPLKHHSYDLGLYYGYALNKSNSLQITTFNWIFVDKCYIIKRLFEFF
jgi:hypothetical protein